MFSFLKNLSPKPYITQKNIALSYERMSTFNERLPWRDYNEKHKCFLLEDNKSIGICFKVTSIPCEARPDSMMADIAKSISEAIKNSIPCEKDNPWIVQVFAQKSADLSSVYNEIEEYFPAKRKLTSLTQDYLANLREHLEFVTQPNGIFHDTQVTNLPFRGGIVHIHAVLYRKMRVQQTKNRYTTRRTNLEDTIRIARKFAEQLRSCGMRVRRMDGNQFYQWMTRWFNPTKNTASFFPSENQKPIGFDLTEQLFFSAPESFSEGWLFDGLPHKVITIQNMTSDPEIGHISAERKRNVDDKVFNLLDHLPEDSIFSMAIVMQSQSDVALNLKMVHHSAVGSHAQAVKVKNEISIAEKSLANGDYLLPVTMSIYLKGTNVDDLHAKESYAEVLLNSNGFKVITDDELFPIDAYLRYLPMCYDYYFDKQHVHRSRYILLSDIAKLLPFYGRSRGSNHPGMVMFNRGGEPWFYDLYADRTKNAHFLLLGETGTGKSNLLNYLIMHDLALYNSRFFIIEAGGSFDLLGDYCQAHGLTVNKIKIDPNHPVSLNPFAHGMRIIDQIDSIKNAAREIFLEEHCDNLLKEQAENTEPLDNSLNENEPRDILGDMVLAALVMITGGEKKEEDKIRRSDRMLIIDAIIDAAYFVRTEGRDQMIASDIVESFERLTQKLDPLRDKSKITRAREMADAMSYFTKDPVSSQFFNSYGSPWPLADLTIIDFGLFASEGYEAHRSIAFAGCMSNVVTLAESNQKGDRQIKLVADENHIFTSVQLIADIQTRVAKMGRKLGLWLWIATQNMKDFPDGARRLLAQCETWMCLSLPPNEIDQVERFKPLTLEQRLLFLSAKKENGKYTEGILLTPKLQCLVRNVPPRRYLVMAATEQSEKNQRALIMKEQNCSEIEAVNVITHQMMQKKQEVHLDD